MEELAHLRQRVAELEARLAGTSEPVEPPQALGSLIDPTQTVHTLLHTLIDMLPAGVIVCDAVGKVVLVNTVARLLLSGGPAENIFEPHAAYSLHHADGTPWPAKDLPLVRAIAIGEVTRDIELLVRYPDGSETVLLAGGVPIRDAVGNTVGAIASFQDITQRKQVETDLRNSEARLRAIVDTAVDGIITIDERGTIETLNPAALRIFGYTTEDLVGQNVKILMPDPYRGEHDQYLDNYRRTGQRKIIGIGREVQGRRKDGSVFPMDLAVSEVRLGSKRVFTGIIRDITERKRVEQTLLALNDTLEQRVFERTAELFNANQALGESEQRFRQITNAIPQVVWIGPPDLSSTLYVNPAYQKVWGCPVESLHADTLSAIEAIHPDDRERATRHFLQVFASGDPGPEDTEEQFRVIWPDGQERQVIGRAFPIRDEMGQVYRVCAIFEDITEHLRLEREVLEISEAERRRIGQDLHDTLGQTLTGVLFLTRILEQALTDRDPAQAKEAGEISAQVTHAIDITRTLARGLVPVDLKAEGLMNGLQAFAQQAQKVMGITCRFLADQPVLLHDSTAATHLYHIAQEATNNAVKHGRATGVDIRLLTDGEKITLTIEDDGRGIAENIDASRGMGLRIMTYRARMIGGQISVRRRQERGTTVECSFRPRQAPAESP